MAGSQGRVKFSTNTEVHRRGITQVMKAQDLPLTQLLQGAKQFIIPIFQRTYSWGQYQCQQLWDDIIRVGGSPDLNSHFIGSAVYIPEEDTSAAISRWLVIDGQQRITTIALLLSLIHI